MIKNAYKQMKARTAQHPQERTMSQNDPRKITENDLKKITENLTAQVQGIVDQGRDRLRQETQQALTEVANDMSANVISQVKAMLEQKPAKVEPQLTTSAPEPEKTTESTSTVKDAIQRMRSFFNSSEPTKVSMTREQALAKVGTALGVMEMQIKGELPEPEAELVMTAARGALAFNIDYAYRRGLVEPPKKGLSTWQTVGLAMAGGAVAVGVGVAGYQAYQAYASANSTDVPL